MNFLPSSSKQLPYCVVIEFYLGYRIFSLKSMKGELYLVLSGAREIQVGHTRKQIFLGSTIQPRNQVTIFGRLHSWFGQSHGLSGPALAMVLF